MPEVAPLTESDIHTGPEMPRSPPSRRARMRAQRLLLRPPGGARAQRARLSQGASRRVASWIDPWQPRGCVGGEDPPGAGRRPPRRRAAPPQRQPYGPAAPTDCQPVVPPREPEPGKRVRTPTRQRRRPNNRSGWTRLRQAPATSPEPHQEERRPVCRPPRPPRDALGAWARWYVEGTGFGCTPCRPSAGPPRGQTRAMPASSPRQRVHVRGGLTRRHALVPSRIDGTGEAPGLVTWWAPGSPQLTAQTSGCLAQAPRPRAPAWLQPRPTGGQQGCMGTYLPA
jgi:hypothetical protein